VLYNLSESIRFISVLIGSFMPSTYKKILNQIGIEKDALVSWKSLDTWGIYPVGTKVNKGDALFPRIDIEKELEELAGNKGNQKLEDKKMVMQSEPQKELITIDDFAKVDLRVAKVITCEKVEGADKLLKLGLEVGKEKRTVVSGIAKYYSPDDLIGKSVVLVANLKPAKLRGIESQGMILAASEGEKLFIVSPSGEIESGSEVR